MMELRARRVQSAVANCASPLAFLSDRLYLLAMVYGGDPTLAAHWTQHYMRLGVRASNVRLWMDNEGVLGWRSTLQIFLEAGVSLSNVTVLASNWTASKDVNGDKLNMRGKLGMVSRAVNTLPAAAAIMIADSDEFFEFPCDMEDRMYGVGRRIRADTAGTLIPTGVRPATSSDNRTWQSRMFCGWMRERISWTGRVVPLRATPEIATQFPAYCQLRRMLGRGWEPMARTHKVVLFEREVRPMTMQHKANDYKCCSFRNIASSHHTERYPTDGRKSRPEMCSLLGVFPHYVMHEQAMGLLRAKTKLTNSFVTHKYKRLLKWMEMHPAAGSASMFQHSLCNDSLSKPHL